MERPRSPKHPALRHIDPATRFLYTPKTVSILLIGAHASQRKLVAVRSWPCFLSCFKMARACSCPLMHSHPWLDLSGVCTLVYLFICTSAHEVVQTLLLVQHVGYSTLQGPASPLVRPHPAVWRLLHGVIVLYLIGLVFFLFQDAHDARQLLKVSTLVNNRLLYECLICAMRGNACHPCSICILM